MKNLWLTVSGGVAVMLLFFVTAFTTVDSGLAKGHGEPYWGESDVAKEGAKLFKKAGCYACHSYRGQQSQVTGPEFDTVGLRLNEDAIKSFIINGTDIMPAFQDKLTGQEIDTLAKWLSQFKTPIER